MYGLGIKSITSKVVPVAYEWKLRGQNFEWLKHCFNEDDLICNELCQLNDFTDTNAHVYDMHSYIQRPVNWDPAPDNGCNDKFMMK